MDISSTGSDGGDFAPETGSTGIGNDTSAQSEAPTPLDLSDDSLIRLKGSDKPVKFADHVRGFQSQATKAAQRAAALERQLQERDAKLRALEQAQRQPQQQASNEDIYGALRSLPYLTGEDAVGVVESIGQQIRQRDMVLLGALKQMQQMQQILGTLGDNYSSQTFESKIAGFIQQGGHDPGYTDFAKELYLAYEGDDLDYEFPQILANRIKQIEGINEAKRRAATQARRQPFVPGKGGNVNPSKPLQIKPSATAKEVADELWATFGETSGT